MVCEFAKWNLNLRAFHEAIEYGIFGYSNTKRGDSEHAARLRETIEHLQAALDEVEAIEPPRVGR
jgi:hypothetical protein